MSANHSLLLFEGDLTAMLPAVFDCFGMRTTGNIETAKGLAEIWEHTNWPRRGRPKHFVHKGVLFNGTWTAVLDREMNMVLDQERCEYCAKKFEIKIFGYMIENVSGSCALYLYAPEKVRGLNIQNFEVIEDFGDPLPQESGITVDEMLEDGAMRVSRRLGFSDSLFAHPASKVLIVGMEDPARAQAVQQRNSTEGSKSKPNGKPSKPTPQSPPEKPWWRLW